MWDTAAYRIPKNQEPHFRTSTKWRIYLTYDFAHCLCDSFEGITHSLCTTEFIMPRESYKWLNQHRDYGCLNLKGTIISKRDIRRYRERAVPRLMMAIYIERSNFRELDSKDYYRLAPGKTVYLLQIPYPIRAVSFIKDEATGDVKEYIYWVSDGSPLAEVRIFTPLFSSDQPGTAPGGFLNEIHSDSEIVWPNAQVETGFHEVRRRAPWPEAEREKTGD
ncbi:Glutaminyl-tRNA synthetase [Collariella sp. IMI 366227]|nr:Glutaminyl-tRNA synthetase [Collariella sp. IMI 366227]